MVRALFTCMTVLVLGFAMQKARADSDEGTPEEQFHRRLSVSEDVSPLGATPFGESFDPYTGELSFRQVDVTLHGTGPDIVIARTFSPGWRTALALPDDGQFADWQLDVPKLTTLVGRQVSGAYAAFGGQWQTNGAVADNRCTYMKYAPLIAGTNGDLFDTDDWWHGYGLSIPGAGTQQLLVKGTSRPSPTMRDASGNAIAFNITTQNHWMIGCASGVASGEPGESFIAVSPQGVKYTLNWFNYYSANAAHLPNPPPGKSISANMASAEAVATRIEDRFGNWVQYHYSGRRVTSIDASDGRLVTIAWRPETDWIDHISVSDASGATRTWTYQYADESQLIAGTNQYLGRLAAVVRPDGTAWSFSLQSLLKASTGPDTGERGFCVGGYFAVANQGQAFSGSMQNPSGLAGTFTLAPVQRIRVGRERPAATCTTAEVPYFIPSSYFNIALTKKVFTGAGVNATWSYTYGNPALYWADQCTNDVCPQHTVTTDVTNPDATITRTEMDDTVDGYIEGRVTAVRTGFNPQDGSALDVQTMSYADPSTASLGNPLGTTLSPLVNVASQGNLAPVSALNRVREGDTYTYAANGFDVFGNPTLVSRSNSIPGQPSMTVQASFLNDASHWLVGLPVAQVNAGSGEIISRNTYDASTSALSARYRFERLLMSYQYDASGQLQSFTDGNGKVTQLSNYKLGVPRSIAYPDGSSQTVALNDFGEITAITNQTGDTTTYAYDSMGRLSHVGYPAGDSVAWSPRDISFSFVNSAERGVPAGHWVRSVTHGGEISKTYYDAWMRPVLTSSASADGSMGTSVRNDYDWAGRTVFLSYPADGSPDMSTMTAGTTTTYDSVGRSVRSVRTSELGSLTTSTAYLEGAKVQTTDPKGHVTVTAFQVLDTPDTSRPLSVSASEGVTQTIVRDVYGNPRSATQGGGGATLPKSWVYDAYYRVCRMTEPESGDYVVAYDGEDNIAWSAAGLAITEPGCGYDQVADAAKTVRSYDAENRLISVIYPNGTDPSTFTYDAAGRPSTATSGLVSWTFGHNKKGQLTTESLSVDGYQWAIGHTYTAEGALASETYPDGKVVSFAPDALGRPTQAGAYASAATYFPDGSLRGFSLGSGASFSAEENARGTLRNLSYGTPAAVAVSEDLTYDANGNLAQLDDLAPGGQRATTFSYDNLDRLSVATNSALWGSESYTYDTLDNILSITNASGENDYGYDTSYLLRTVSNAGTVVHRYDYDARGNVTGRDGAVFSMDDADRMVAIQGQVGYLYDAAGRRVRQSPQGAANPLYSAYSSDGRLMWGYDPATTIGTDYIYLDDKLVASTRNVTSVVIGNIDGVSNATSETATLAGWACSTGITTSLQVQVYAGAPSAQGTLLGTYTANVASEAAIGQACHTTGAAYRFSVPLVDAVRVAHAGQALYVVGLSPIGGTNAQLPGSGAVTVPASIHAPSAPGAPTAVLAGDLSSISVSWAAASNAPTYQLELSTGGGAWVSVQSSQATSYVKSSPSDGSYAFRVQACNASGCSAWITGNTVTVAHIPAAPASLSVPATSTGAVSLAWSAATYATAYEVEQSLNGGAWNTVYHGAGTSVQVPVGATSSAVYRVQACNANGCSGFTTSAAVAVTIPPATAPSLSGGGASLNGAYGLSWSGVAGASTYVLYESVNGSGLTAIQNAASTSWSTSGRGNGTYAYQVQACNAGGCGPLSNGVTVSVTLVPAPPAQVTLTQTLGKVMKYTVTWTSVPLATYYELARSDTQAVVYSGTALTAVLASNVSQNDPIDYNGIVRACDAAGCSAWVPAR